MLSSFDDGDYKVFFELWDDNIPTEVKDSDTDAQSLEFYLHIHFTIYPLRSHPARQVCMMVLCQKFCLHVLMTKKAQINVVRNTFLLGCMQTKFKYSLDRQCFKKMPR